MKKGQANSVSIVDIAARLDISKATVGFVLSGKAKQMQVADKTARRVEEAAREMGYVPNQLARSLRQQHSNLIGIVLPNGMAGWLERFYNGLRVVLRDTDYNTFFCLTGWDLKEEERQVGLLRQHRVDGIMLRPRPESIELYRSVIACGMPLVFLGDTLDELPEATCVLRNARDSVEKAVAHLIDSGRKRIGLFGAKHGTFESRNFRESYLRAMKQHQLPLRNDWEMWIDVPRPTGTNIQDLIELEVRRVLAEPSRPNAFLVLNDALARELWFILHRLGIQVPGDVAIIGSGNVLSSPDPRSGLSTLQEPVEQIGQIAGKLMLDLIDGLGEQGLHRMVDLGELIIRSTSHVEQSRHSSEQ